IGNGVTSIGDSAFGYCSGLTSITIPSSVTSIGSSAFYGCTGLTSITIPNSITSVGWSAFGGCSGLTSITLPFVGSTLNGTENIHFGYIFGASSYSNNSSYVPTSLKTVVITGGNSISDYAFYNCSGLTSVTISNGVNSIGKYAFEGCSGLTSISIPSSVTSIGGGAFGYCSGLTSITIPSSVTSIGKHAFYNCYGLSSVTFENTDGWYIVEDSSAISGIDVDVTNWNTNATNLKNTYCGYYWITQ
ncbi:MAG: leucine-rich repeat domain-containing protein, partial [Clostridia bacterium]|nr:leucine-rich repeat domain-containing protein [Clostridia bacterium]